MYSILCILISIPLTNEYSFNLYKFIAYTYEKNIYQSHEFLFILTHKPPLNYKIILIQKNKNRNISKIGV